MKKKIWNDCAAGGGLLLLILGLFLIKLTGAPEGVLRALPYLCVGLGCGLFGHGCGEILARRAVKKRPDVQKQLEIERGDERNIAIGNRAKAKAYDMMVFVFGALLVSFALMQVNLAAVLLVFAYLFVVGYGVYCRVKFEKEM